jgi:PAS domain S-box-containing protein
MRGSRNRKTNDDRKGFRQELEMLRTLSDMIDGEIYVSDPKTYQILFANRKKKRRFGQSIIGKKCYKVFQKESGPCSSCDNKRIFGKNLGKTCIREHQNMKNGQWYKSMSKAIKWAGGRYVRCDLSIDITMRKRTEEALQEIEGFFRSVVENSHSGILIIDDNFRIIHANNEAARIGGYSRNKIVGRDFREFLTEESKPLAQERYLRRQRGEKVPSTYEISIVRMDGQKRNLAVKSAALRCRDGEKRSIVQLLDVTDRRRIEDEKRRFEDRLSALNVYGQDLNMARNMEEIYKLTLDAADKTLGFGIASVLMIEGGMLSVVAYRGYANDISLKLPIDGEKGLTVKAAKKCRSLNVPDVTKAKAYVGGFPAEIHGNHTAKLARKGTRDIRSELAVPIKIGIKVLGVLNAESEKTAAFDDEDRKLLEILASHAATAITNLKRQGRLSALNDYGRNLNMARNMEETCKLTLDAMEKTLGFEFATVFIVEGKVLRLVAHRGYPKQLSVCMPLDSEKGVSVKAAKTRKPVYIRDVRKEKAYVQGRPGMLSELAVPIKIANKVLGVLNVESERLSAFDENDRELLEILASHAATAVSNLRRQDQLRELSEKLAYLMKNTTEIMNVKDMHQRLKTIAKAVRKFGWRRVVISLRDENLEGTDLVAAGLTKEEIRLLIDRKAAGHVWKERLSPKFERFKIGEFYYLPWADAWIRENVHGVTPGTPAEEVTTYAGVPSSRSSNEMVDWHPQDMLYAPLRTPDGRIVGILSMDDPIDGRVPTREDLAPFELFLHQAAIIIENAQLIESLREAREHLEQKVDERTRELKKSQEQLLKAQRLAVIGELAGMVGHDLRNPLTSISAAAYYVRMQLKSIRDSKSREMLELIEKNIVYANKIINDLLDYSREIELELTEHTPRLMIKESLLLVEIPNNVRVVDLTENKPRVKVDIDKLKRAFVNIIKNAVDAMPDGGTLTMKSEKVGRVLNVSFSDTGVGMSKETAEKIWTPLFTTKAKGMGFGLPICKRIVEAHGGTIAVKSVTGTGTTFTITIPIKPKTEGGGKIWVQTLESSLLTTTKT